MMSLSMRSVPEGRLSGGALCAIELAKPQIFKEGWLERVFAPEAVMRSVRDIRDPPKVA